LSERLVFSKNDATEQVEFQTDKATYQIRDKITATLFLTPSLSGRAGERCLSGRAGERSGRAGDGCLSVAVTDDKDVAVDESTTILSSLLLSSELKGYIENPAWYLHDDAAMDLLMMTHGWRRYNIPDVVQGRFEQPKRPFQLYQSISGRVETLSLNRPVRDSEIMIMMQNKEGRGFSSAKTDASGRFAVQDLDFPDSTTFFIQALSRNGHEDLIKLAVDNEAFPTLTYAPQNLFLRKKAIDAEIKDESDLNALIVKAEQRAKFDEDIWTHYLDELVVTAQRIVKREESRFQYWANSSSDRTITRETIEAYKYPSIMNYIQMITGVSMVIEGAPSSNNPGKLSIYLTTTSATFTSGKPAALVLIDGAESDLYNNFSVDDIESIDVFSGVSATAFGVRGAGGAISITTRKGGDLKIQPPKPNNLVYTPLGYQNPVEFYAPKYETLSSRQSPIPDYRTTIFWKPDVVLSDDGEASFEFYSSDYPSTYSVVIEGLTSDGKIVRQVERITVSGQ
jgi:hypothetical protein